MAGQCLSSATRRVRRASTIGRAAAIVCSMVTLTLQPARAAEPSAPLSAQLGLEEAQRPVSERPGWRPARKIVVRNLQLPGIQYLQSSAPDVQFVVTDTTEAAIENARGADAVIGWCDARILKAGPQIRWIQFLYAGVESCVSVPAVRDGAVLLTNMQRVQAPIGRTDGSQESPRAHARAGVRS